MARDGRGDERDQDGDLLPHRPADPPSGTSIDRSPGGSSSIESDAPTSAAPPNAVDPRDTATVDREPRDRDPFERRPAQRRERIRWRHRTLRFRESESTTLQTIGTFRVVDVADLAVFDYAGEQRRLDADLRALEREGLIARRTYASRDGIKKLVTLTRDGYAVATLAARDPAQTLGWGSVKLKELTHDAALYRIYRTEAARIERQGGVVRRVVLDPELKGLVASAILRPEDPTRDGDDSARHDRQAAVAGAYHLRVVDGTIQIPDLRIEYDTAHGDRTRVDVELTTENYGLEQIVDKARAGFTIYAPASRAERLAAALEERGILADILSL